MSTIGSGPYCNEDGEWWVPVAAEPNRMRAAAIVRGCMDPEATLRYEDQVVATLTPHEVGCDCGRDCRRPVRAWHFVEVWP